jgi:hypothetical protein
MLFVPVINCLFFGKKTADHFLKLQLSSYARHYFRLIAIGLYLLIFNRRDWLLRPAKGVTGAPATTMSKAGEKILCRTGFFEKAVDRNRRPTYMHPRCPDGGIGRRASFRCWFPKGSGGSSPLLGTKFLFPNVHGRSEEPQKARFSGLFCFLASNNILLHPKILLVTSLVIGTICQQRLAFIPTEFGQDTNMMLADTAIRAVKPSAKPIEHGDSGGLHILCLRKARSSGDCPTARTGNSGQWRWPPIPLSVSPKPAGNGITPREQIRRGTRNWSALTSRHAMP